MCYTLVFATALKVIYVVRVFVNVAAMRVTLKYYVNVSVGKRGITAGAAVVKRINDKINTLGAKSVGLCLNEGCKLAAYLELNVFYLVRGN